MGLPLPHPHSRPQVPHTYSSTEGRRPHPTQVDSKIHLKGQDNQDTPKGPLARTPRPHCVCNIPALLLWPLAAALCLTLGINISHFTLEEFASHRPPWQQPSFPSLGSHTTLLGKRPPLLLSWK